MSRVVSRFAACITLMFGMAFAVMAFATIASPGVSWACDPGTVWDPVSSSCVGAAPPPPAPPPPIPVTMCIGAPVPFVPMSWCFPVGG